MNIAELFVKLNVTGADKAKKDVGGVSSGMKSVQTSSLAAKAAILGAIYALERMVSGVGQIGTGLNQFGTLTGDSVVELQKWQAAAKATGGTAEGMASSFKQAKEAARAWVYEGKGPANGPVIFDELGLSEEELGDTFKLLQRLREYAQKTNSLKGLERDQANKRLGDFVSEDTIAAFRDERFDPSKQTNILSEGQIKALDSMNVRIQGIYSSFQKTIARIASSKEGQQLFKDIEGVVKSILNLTESFSKMAATVGVFKTIGKIVQGWADIFGLIKTVVDDLNTEKTDPGTMLTERSRQQQVKERLDAALPDPAALRMPPRLGPERGPSSVPETVNIELTQNFGADFTDKQSIGRASQEGLEKVFYQIPTRFQSR